MLGLGVGIISSRAFRKASDEGLRAEAAKGMAEKSDEFKKSGGEIYVKN